ncbi:MAG: EamA family transporter [Saprospiraceae bacterium]|nr:DMT family transporter [Bacteroidia bacterium]NNE14852.1 EamA family transporter [Saprospiraceae bacterium]NNL91894.1 EamA family transporter [Saprospiraceae bacterium]
MTKKKLAYFQLHFAVLLYGLTAILGDLISISAINLVWWRVLITSISLLFFIELGKQILKMDKRLVLIYAGIGVIVAVHWITFYGAIKYSNASIVLATMATTSLFTALIEPLVTKKKFSKLEFVLGLLVIPPMVLIAKNIDLDLQKGIWIGLISAFLASLFASLNKKYVEKASSYQITFIEMFSAFLFISIVLPFVLTDINQLMPSPTDWIYLIILSLLCTTLAYVISMKALKHVSAFDANLVVNLEPVYGILLAIVILNEHHEMSLTFYLGVLMIMLVVFSHPILQKYSNGRK